MMMGYVPAVYGKSGTSVNRQETKLALLAVPTRYVIQYSESTRGLWS